ncbi:hypothetical protein HD806DRAFT_478002, partial [Xylariaceae sp. AK1471]
MSELPVTRPKAPSLGFPRFADLPVELRLIVWEMAMEEPRIIHISDHPLEPMPRRLTIDGVLFNQVPEFFFVNQECRQVALKQYTAVAARFKTYRFPNFIVRQNLAEKDAREMYQIYKYDVLEVNWHLKSNDIFAYHDVGNTSVVPFTFPRLLATTEPLAVAFPQHPSARKPFMAIQNYMFVTGLRHITGIDSWVEQWVKRLRRDKIKWYLYIACAYKESAVSSQGVVVRDEGDPSNFTLQDLTFVPGDPKHECDHHSSDSPSAWEVELFKLWAEDPWEVEFDEYV